MQRREREGGRRGRRQGGNTFLSVVFLPEPPNMVNFVLKC